MKLGLNDGNWVEIEKYNKMYTWRSSRKESLTVKVKWTPTVFEEIRDLFTEENTNPMVILDDMDNAITFDGYTVASMNESISQDSELHLWVQFDRIDGKNDEP